jgi:hypothetical protein
MSCPVSYVLLSPLSDNILILYRNLTLELLLLLRSCTSEGGALRHCATLCCCTAEDEKVRVGIVAAVTAGRCFVKNGRTA